jgi:phosphopantothenoylcysteine decarboxylase/phosphopantothenate--cysteine ligase
LPDTNIHLVKVRSAQQMFEATQTHFYDADIIVLAAAVADYTPATVADKKIKKKEATFNIELAKTIDIAKTLGAEKQEHQILVLP